MPAGCSAEPATRSLPAAVAAATTLLILGCSPVPVSASSAARPASAPVTVQFAAGSLTATGLDDANTAAWQRRISVAAGRIVAADLQPGWNGELTVVLPATEADFTASTGVGADEASAATTCADGASTIVINPAILGAGDSWLLSTLVHEGVHAATGSACVPAGESLGWAREGLAESVAAAADPTTASRNHTLVKDYLATSPVPPEPPADPQTSAEYALSVVAVSAVQEHLGAKASAFLRRAALSASTITETEASRVNRWYRDALDRLD